MNARFWKGNNDGTVSCSLCFRQCRLGDGQPGICGVRFSTGGTLIFRDDNAELLRVKHIYSRNCFRFRQNINGEYRIIT